MDGEDPEDNEPESGEPQELEAVQPPGEALEPALPTDSAEPPDDPDDPLLRPPAGLGTVLRAQEVEEEFGEQVRATLPTSFGRSFVVRLLGGRADGRLTGVEFGEFTAALSRATSWVNNAFSGVRSQPGVGLAHQGSMVVQFVSLPDEELYELSARAVSPTAISGHWMGALLVMDATGRQATAERLRARASGTYLTALQDLAEMEADIAWLTLDTEHPVRIHASRDAVASTVDFLDQSVELVERTVDVRGILYAVDGYRHTFKMDVTDGELAGRTIRGTFSEANSESLAWRQAVGAKVLIREPERYGLPRSPGVSYELLKIESLIQADVPLEPPSESGTLEQLSLPETSTGEDTDS